jgi:hypothetical protein
VPNGGDHNCKVSEVVATRLDHPGFLERRDSKRFPFHEELQYRERNRRGENLAGAGRTLDMSSSGILFSTQESIQVGSIVEVSVDWPASLNGTCPLNLVAVGLVVRSEGHWAAILIQRYGFRTRGSGGEQTAAHQLVDDAGGVGVLLSRLKRRVRLQVRQHRYARRV